LKLINGVASVYEGGNYGILPMSVALQHKVIKSLQHDLFVTILKTYTHMLGSF